MVGDFTKLICCIVLCVTTNSQAQRTVGDYCLLRNGNAGVCHFLSDCPTALAVIKVQKPAICSFRGNSAIVCCGDGTNNQIPFTNSNSRPSIEEQGHGEGFDVGVVRPERPFTNNWNPPGRPSIFTNKPYRPTAQIEVYEPDNDDDDTKLHFTTGEQKRPITGIQTDGQKRPITGTQTGGQKRPITGIQTQGDRITTQNMNRPGSSFRTSQLKCKEYSQSVTHTVEALPLLLDPTPVALEVARCDISKLPLIVGGEKTVPGEFPHMAALGYQDGREVAWNCGGSLISDQYVLTAAHCTISSKGPPVVVRLGELNLKRGDDGAQPRDYTVGSVIKHPDYKAPSKYNDIALLRLSQRVQFNKFIRPACLFAEDSFPVNKTIATGWGQIDFAEQPSEILLKVALDILDNSLCNRLYRSSAHTQTLSQGIIPSMMCAGVLKGGKDTCHGDSGGPIQITHKQNKCIYYVIGVTSFGKFCAAENAPGVYTRVSQFLPWIESVVWP